MRIPRIYHPEPLTSHSHIALCEDAANHIGRVLRMGPGQALQLFDGSNQVFDAEITSASKKSVEGIYDPEIDRTRCKPHYATFF